MIVMMLKDAVRRAFALAGLDIRRRRPASSPEVALVAMLHTHHVNLVFDIGANTGQFGQQLRRSGYLGRIVSFEPSFQARRQLLRTAHDDRLWEVAPQMAIGSRDGEIELNLSRNSVSSSVLQMLDAHLSAAPGSAYGGTELVLLRRLDEVARPYLTGDSVMFIKIDTQGYEHEVLAGAGELTGAAAGFQLEMSLVPLYAGQRLYEEMMRNMQNLGFSLWSLHPEFLDPVTGRLLQVDAVFFR